jgi:uncharacterized protein
MIIGAINKVSVVRESDIAYVLTDGIEELFLHKKEALRPYLPGEEIEVFIYVDNIGRPTASTKEPFCSISHAGWLEVVSVSYELGVFVHYGLVKDALLSKDDLPLSLAQWPIVGDQLICILKEKKNHLFAKQIGRKSVRQYFQPSIIHEEGVFVDGWVSYLLLEGLIVFTLQGDEIFVHYNNTRKTYRIGEMVSVRILKRQESLEYMGSLIGQKETMLDVDSKRILEYLQNHAGSMRFTDKSSPIDIQAAFRMSKGAFKRALGTLYKANLVELLDDSTILKS